jgi:hypothetical protein
MAKRMRDDYPASADSDFRSGTVDPMTDLDTVATWKQRRNFAKKMARLEMGRSDEPGSLGEWYGRGVRRALHYLLHEADEMLQRLGYDTADDTDSDGDYDTESAGEDKGDRDAKGDDCDAESEDDPDEAVDLTSPNALASLSFQTVGHTRLPSTHEMTVFLNI